MNFISIDESRFYKVAIDAESIAHTIAFAIEQPSDVAINEMIIRPNRSSRLNLLINCPIYTLLGQYFIV